MNFVFRVLLLTGLLSFSCQFAGSAGSDLAVPDSEKLAPRLVEPLELETFNVAGRITSEGARRLMGERLRTGDQDPPVYEFLSTAITAEERNYVFTDTVATYLEAKRTGAVAYTNWDITYESWFVDAASKLRYLERANSSLIEYEIDLMDLSVSFLSWNGSEEKSKLEKDAASGMTLREYARPWRRRIRNLIYVPNKHEIRFSTSNLDYVVKLLALGDITGDGIQDGLIAVAYYYRGGSGRGYDSYAIVGDDKRRIWAAEPFHWTLPESQTSRDNMPKTTN